MNKELQLNYYEEYTKYTGGNGTIYSIDKKNDIASSSHFQIFGRSSHFSNDKAWKDVFNNVLFLNYKNINTKDFQDSSKTVVQSIKNNTEIYSNHSFSTSMSSLFSRLSDDIEKETGFKINFQESRDLDTCLKDNKENAKKNKLLVKQHLAEIKKNIKIGGSSSLKTSKVFDVYVELSKKQKELEKEGITTKLKFSYSETQKDYDKENILILKTRPNLEITLNSNSFDFEKEIKEIETSKLITATKKKKLNKILNEYNEVYKKFKNYNYITLSLISKVLGNEKIKENVYGIKELEKEVINYLNKVSNLEVKQEKSSGLSLN